MSSLKDSVVRTFSTPKSVDERIERFIEKSGVGVSLAITALILEGLKDPPKISKYDTSGYVPKTIRLDSDVYKLLKEALPDYLNVAEITDRALRKIAVGDISSIDCTSQKGFRFFCDPKLYAKAKKVVKANGLFFQNVFNGTLLEVLQEMIKNGK